MHILISIDSTVK